MSRIAPIPVTVCRPESQPAVDHSNQSGKPETMQIAASVPSTLFNTPKPNSLSPLPLRTTRCTHAQLLARCTPITGMSTIPTHEWRM